jgi:hypothetical protein
MNRGFDWKFYVDHYPDLKAITSEREALRHWRLHGKKEGRVSDVHQLERHKTQQNTSSSGVMQSSTGDGCRTASRFAVLIHIGNSKCKDALKAFLSRIPVGFADIYVSHYDADVEAWVQAWNPVKTYLVPNRGMDILPFLTILADIADKYDGFLKLHSKTDEHWRTMMYESLMPKHYQGYQWIAEQMKEGFMVGSEAYRYEIAAQPVNRDLIHDLVKDYPYIDNDKITASWNVVNNESTLLDVDFYLKYHPDLRTSHKRCQIDAKKAKMHFKHSRNKEKCRIGNPDDIIQAATVQYSFFAGTMFWMPQTIAKHAVAVFQAQQLPFEERYVTNVVARVTHSWEYLFGIMAHQLGSGLIGRQTVLFLLPEIGDPFTNPKTRKIIKMMYHLHTRPQYNVKVAFCTSGSEKYPLSLSKRFIANMLRYPDSDNTPFIDNAHERHNFKCDVVVCTSWETFKLGQSLRKDGNAHGILFFCQEPEDMPSSAGKSQNAIQSFYDDKEIPAITMTRYLARKVEEAGRVARPIPLDIKQLVYNHQHQANRTGVVVSYISFEPDRLPDLTKSVVKRLNDMYEDVQVHTFGTQGPHFEELHRVKHHGILSQSALADLYNQCQVGIVFSNGLSTNMPLEMRACGLRVIELDTEANRVDLDNTQFILVSPDVSTIVHQVDLLIKTDKGNEYDALYPAFWDTICNYHETTAFEQHLKELFMQPLFK